MISENFKDNLNSLNCVETKTLLITYLFSILELSKFRYKLLESKGSKGKVLTLLGYSLSRSG